MLLTENEVILDIKNQLQHVDPNRILINDKENCQKYITNVTSSIIDVTSIPAELEVEALLGDNKQIQSRINFLNLLSDHQLEFYTDYRVLNAEFLP
jgi:hypothetical protein